MVSAAMFTPESKKNAPLNNAGLPNGSNQAPWRVGMFALLIGMAYVQKPLPFIIGGRLIRNAWMSDFPEALPPAYPSCNDSELVEKVTILVTVKDTCSQKYSFLENLRKMYPKDMRVVYAYPGMPGCKHVNTKDKIDFVRQTMFPRYTEIEYPAHESPIGGYHAAHELLQTPYVMLSRNDAYPMERQFLCELYRALDANPQYPIAAPTIYEKGDNDIFVPHGHHENLHVRPTQQEQQSAGQEYPHIIDYDLSVDMLSKRAPHEFKQGPQMDFLEDHGFMGRTSNYRQYVDPKASFTMEYMDMILNMRADNTSVLYVPTARCVFDVALSKLTWEDLPYFSYKRSEQIGHQVRQYLSAKWDVGFPNTGIWNYVRYAVLSRLVLEDPQDLPDTWEDHAAVFFAWFQSIGFNTYEGHSFPEAASMNFSFDSDITIQRSVAALDYSVPKDWVPKQKAVRFLPQQEKKTWYLPTIAFDYYNLPIGVNVQSCEADNAASYADCGMVVVETADSADAPCMCYTYATLFNLNKTWFGVHKLLNRLKIPARSLMYPQMKYLQQTVANNTVDCDQVNAQNVEQDLQRPCRMSVARFTPTARVVKWSWFGSNNGVFDDQEL